MDEPLAKVRVRMRRTEYNPQPFIDRIEELRRERNLSMRQVGIRSGLDHQAIRRIKSGHRPGMMYCILLADFFEVNPNELLQLAGWPALKIFDIRTESAEHLPPEVIDVAIALAEIPDPGTRKRVSESLKTLLVELRSKS